MQCVIWIMFLHFDTEINNMIIIEGVGCHGTMNERMNHFIECIFLITSS